MAQGARHDPPELADLRSALKRFLRTGLPVTPTTAEPVLRDLRGVRARATRADEELSRVDALDRLLTQQLRRYGSVELRPAAQILFGMNKGAGRNLTGRRLQAAEVAGYDPDHFRKRIEPAILDQLAWQLHKDSMQYAPRGRKRPPSEPSGDTPVLTPEDIADEEQADHEVLLSRIWSDVYGLRAELIERERWRAAEGQETRFEEAAGGSLWYLARLLTHLDAYLDRYGTRILHGEAEFNADGLIRLAGWTGDLTDSQSQELRYLVRRIGAWNRAGFLEAISSRSLH